MKCSCDIGLYHLHSFFKSRESLITIHRRIIRINVNFHKSFFNIVQINNLKSKITKLSSSVIFFYFYVSPPVQIVILPKNSECNNYILY